MKATVRFSFLCLIFLVTIKEICYGSVVNDGPFTSKGANNSLSKIFINSRKATNESKMHKSNMQMKIEMAFNENLVFRPYTFHMCKYDNECFGGRLCYKDYSNWLKCNGDISQGCHCGDKDKYECDIVGNLDNCLQGDRCLLYQGTRYCISCLQFSLDYTSLGYTSKCISFLDSFFPNNNDYTGKRCAYNSDCDGLRSCYSLESITYYTKSCDPGDIFSDDNCMCIPLFNGWGCTRSSDCMANDRCWKNFDQKYCLSCSTESTNWTPVDSDTSNCVMASASSTPTTTSQTSPPPTMSSSVATSPFPKVSSSVATSPSPTTSVMLGTSSPPKNIGQECRITADCPGKEVCGWVNNERSPEDLELYFNECFGDNYLSLACKCDDTYKQKPRTPSPSLTGGPTDCIAISSLRKFSPSELVFPFDFQASVLCDKHKNCATPNHIVMHNGQAMSMKLYCSNKPDMCSKHVMVVNSPRMKLGLRVLSNVDEFQFTALAARYGSKAEELLLAAMVHLGL